MNNLGLVIIAVGVIYAVYSIIFMNKVNIYNKKSYIVILNRQQFLKLQFKISLINSACAIIFGLAVHIYKLTSPYILLYPVLFHLINYLTIFIGKRRQYIEYK